MIAVDTNVLVYAHRGEFPQHGPARVRSAELAPVFWLGAFLRVATPPRLLAPPFTAREACRALGPVLESPSLHFLTP
jgi:predicted nucleic acid-binding protein